MQARLGYSMVVVLLENKGLLTNADVGVCDAFLQH